MTTLRNVTATILAAYVSIAAVNAYAFGLGDVTGAVTGSSGGTATSGAKVDVGALTTTGKGLMGKFNSAFVNMLLAQKKTADALGLKDQSDALAKHADYFGKGNVDNDEIDRGVTASEDAKKAIADKIAEGAPLDAAAKKTLATAVPHYVKALAETAGLPKEFQNFAQSVTQGVAGLSSNPMNAAKLKDATSTPVYVATKLPDLLSNFADTSKNFMSFAKSNDVNTGDLDKKI